MKVVEQSRHVLLLSQLESEVVPIEGASDRLLEDLACIAETDVPSRFSSSSSASLMLIVSSLLGVRPAQSDGRNPPNEESERIEMLPGHDS